MENVNSHIFQVNVSLKGFNGFIILTLSKLKKLNDHTVVFKTTQPEDQTMKKSKLISLTSSVLVLALHGIAAEAETILYQQPPSAEELGQVLFGKTNAGANPETGLKKRSFELVASKPKISDSAKVIESASDELTSVGLPIEFAFNSDAILPESVPFLEEIGKMLSMKEYGDKQLIIEGHTDAVGSDSYNLVLSQRRARAVSHYLEKKYSVQVQRLKPRGLGETKPLPDYGPEDKENRRVQFYSAR